MSNPIAPGASVLTQEVGGGKCGVVCVVGGGGYMYWQGGVV